MKVNCKILNTILLDIWLRFQVKPYLFLIYCYELPSAYHRNQSHPVDRECSKIYHSIITYNHIRVIVIVNELSIIVDILIVRESLMIMRLFNLAYVLPGHMTSECSLNLHDKRNLIWVSESVSSILIELKSLDIVVIDQTITTAT